MERQDKFKGTINYENHNIHYEVGYNWGDEDLVGFGNHWYFIDVNVDGNDIEEFFSKVDEEIIETLIIKDIKLNYPNMS